MADRHHEGPRRRPQAARLTLQSAGAWACPGGRALRPRTPPQPRGHSRHRGWRPAMPGCFSVPGQQPSTLGRAETHRTVPKGPRAVSRGQSRVQRSLDVFRCGTLCRAPSDLDLSPIHGLTMPSSCSPPVPPGQATELRPDSPGRPERRTSAPAPAAPAFLQRPPWAIRCPGSRAGSLLGPTSCGVCPRTRASFIFSH